MDYTFRVMSFFLVIFCQVRTDRTRCIRAPRAWAQVGSKTLSELFLILRISFKHQMHDNAAEVNILPFPQFGDTLKNLSLAMLSCASK